MLINNNLYQETVQPITGRPRQPGNAKASFRFGIRRANNVIII